jgi:site-specific DNA-methyltransferase (adenine-specific)
MAQAGDKINLALSSRILIGDCRKLMVDEGPFDMVLADPPYGDTSLSWDRRVTGWADIARDRLKQTGSLWVFGSMRFFINETPAIVGAGFRYAQDIVWEKHNGSGFHADRFKRVHEHVVQFYRDDVRWSDVFNDVQTTPDATARTVRRKKRPAHMGHIEAGSYTSADGGPRLMRSVISIPSCHGHAIHPTEKPIDLLLILIRTSCPINGLVGDFFAGSGSAGEACVVSGRAYVGTEIDPDIATNAGNRSLFMAGSAISRPK